MPPPPRPAPTVYFDGSCPLCRAEIAHYRRQAGADALHWVDVSAAGAALGDGLDCRRAMARFHVRDADGRLHSGGAAFACLWRALPGWRWLGRATGVPPLSWLLEAAYRGFLPLRPALQRRLGPWLARRAAPGGRP